jgi:enoyl-CoA hydratase/carnithine racemase
VATNEYQTLSLTSSSGVARVVLDHGEINLLDAQMFGELAAVIDQVANDPDVRVVVLSSANADFFISHFDVTLIQRSPGMRQDWQQATKLAAELATGTAASTPPNPFHTMCEQLRTMPKATIAVIEGRAGGGGSEVALSCDMRFAARDRAVFNQPEVALGIVPGGSGTVRLPRLIGRSRALEVILGCDDVDADLAEQWGWVNRTFDDSHLWAHVNNLATRIASFPGHAIAAAKLTVLRAEAGVADHLRLEGAAYQSTLGHAATRDAMDAFMSFGGQTRDGELRLGELAGDIGVVH